MMAAQKTNRMSSASRALRRLGFRQTLRGALIIGFLVGIMMGAQGAAYAAAYPDQHARDMFVASLKSVPSLGFMAGEIDDALTPASYSIYKSITLVTLLVGIWSLMATTRLLRGQEEDGRLEQIVAGRTTKLKASMHLLTGFFCSLTLAYVIAWSLIAALGMDPQVKLSADRAALLTLGAFLPGIFFGGLGVLTSQLSLTRGRAMAYALVPLLALFSIRGAANSVTDWNWLKHFSPFGWTDLLNPVRDPHIIWILPTLGFMALFVTLGLYLAKKRDLGQSILPQSTHAKSHPYLLGSDLQLAIRHNIPTFISWSVGTLAFASLIAAMGKVAADALSSSPAFVQIMTRLGGAYDDLVVAFIGFGMLDGAFILLVMAAVCMGGIRAQEAKGYLDNILIQPIKRTGWLARRLVIILVMTTIIYIAAGYAVWQICQAQGVSLDLGNILQNCLAIAGVITLLVGIGAVFYGILPRFASIAMFAVIIWAFLISVVKSFFHLNDWIDKTSLLHYLSFDMNKTPDWTQFIWLTLVGCMLIAIGIWRFAKRDIVNE